jgi:signal transduction histidine kinase
MNRMMVSRRLPAIGALVAGFALAGFLFFQDQHGSAFGEPTFPPEWVGACALLLSLAFTLAVTAVLVGDSPIAFVLLLVSALVIAIAGYPLPLHPEFVVAALVSVSAAGILVLRPSLRYGIAAGVLLLRALFSVPRNFMGQEAFGNPIADPPLAARVLSLVVLVVIPGLSAVARHWYERALSHRGESSRLNEHILRLSRANADFQQFATNVETESADRERNRIAREIHDATGYYFTNLLMMLKAALVMVPEASDKLRRLLSKALSQTQEGIDETRRALRSLRDTSSGQTGHTALRRMIENFAVVTGMEVDVHCVGSMADLGAAIERLVFRSVQEGLTNAFRHGKATHVEIFVTRSERELSVGVYDNGLGTSGVKKGIGLSGMEERVSQYGGTVSFASLPRGFGVSLRIPFPKAAGRRAAERRAADRSAEAPEAAELRADFSAGDSAMKENLNVDTHRVGG